MTQLAVSRCKQAEYERRVWDVVPEANTPFEALIEPQYWAHVSAKMRPWDHIEVRSEDGSYFAELLVQDAGRLFAKVAVLRKHDLRAIDVGEADAVSTGHEIKHAGPYAKWRVIRLADKSMLKDKFETKGAAQSWLAEHLKGLAA